MKAISRQTIEMIKLWLCQHCDEQQQAKLYNAICCRRHEEDKQIFHMETEFDRVMSRFTRMELVKMGQVNHEFDSYDAWFRIDDEFILCSSDTLEDLMVDGSWDTVLQWCHLADLPSPLQRIIPLWEQSIDAAFRT